MAGNQVIINDGGDDQDTTLLLNDRPLMEVTGYHVERIVGDVAKVTFTIFVKKVEVKYDCTR